jgi:hypothetical protein
MSTSLELWHSRLQRIGEAIREASTPDHGRIPTIEARMTADQHRRAQGIRRESADRVNRLNSLAADAANLLLEQPSVVLAAGVTQATLAEPKPFVRWHRAVTELTGNDPDLLAIGDWARPQRLACEAIGKLLAAAARALDEIGTSQAQQPNQTADEPKQLPEHLATVGLDCAVRIMANPSAWTDATDWLVTLSDAMRVVQEGAA